MAFKPNTNHQALDVIGTFERFGMQWTVLGVSFRINPRRRIFVNHA